VTVNEYEIARHLDIDRQKVFEQLKELQHFHLLDYEPQKDSPQIVFSIPRADSETMSFNYELLKNRRAAHEKRLTMMKHYVTEHLQCRSQTLLSYFGETNSVRCGICDVCLGRNRLDLSDLEFDQISEQLKSLLEQHPLSIRDVVSKTGKTTEKQVLKTIQFLLDSRELEFNESNQLILRR
jgi:ATP-dependent DNA helicase RecQ